MPVRQVLTKLHTHKKKTNIFNESGDQLIYTIRLSCVCRVCYHKGGKTEHRESLEGGGGGGGGGGD